MRAYRHKINKERKKEDRKKRKLWGPLDLLDHVVPAASSVDEELVSLVLQVQLQCLLLIAILMLLLIAIL